jgi:hypothetical protein
VIRKEVKAKMAKLQKDEQASLLREESNSVVGESSSIDCSSCVEEEAAPNREPVENLEKEEILQPDVVDGSQKLGIKKNLQKKIGDKINRKSSEKKMLKGYRNELKLAETHTETKVVKEMLKSAKKAHAKNVNRNGKMMKIKGL